MNPRQRGLLNQRKSKQWILKNPDKYGITDEDRIQVAGLAHYQGDFFSVKYNERIENINGKDVKLFDRFGWDIMTMPETGFDCPVVYVGNLPVQYFVYLIQVKTNWELTSENLEYLRHLIEFKVPFYVRKELHVWRTNVKVPFVYNLNQKGDVDGV